MARVLCLAACLALCALRASAQEVSDESAAFHAAAELYRQARGDRSSAAEAFRRFVQRYPRGERAADAYFTIGEIAFARGLELEDSDPGFSAGGAQARIPEGALKSFDDAEEAYAEAAKRATDEGLRDSARYRLGEVAYDKGDWTKAAEAFQAAATASSKSYAVPKALLGLAYVSLARGDFAGAGGWLKRLSAEFPDRLKQPGAAFARGVLAAHEGDYAQAETLLGGLSEPEARYYLGQAYLLWQKPLLAATIFNKLAEDAAAPVDVREASAFFAGDAFFQARDFDGAATRYSQFARAFPFSRYKVAALYRLGASSFEKGDYGQARLSFGSLLSQYPSDFYASLSRYFIGESYLAAEETREALFSYSDVVANGRKDLQPRALYRLAWTQLSLGDYSRAASTCETFVQRFPGEPLARDVYMLLGHSRARLQQKDKALAAFQRVLDVAPGTELAEQALFSMLKLQYDQKDYGSILTAYQFILRQLPQSLSKWRALSYLTAAETYVRLDRSDEAKAIYEMILKVYPADVASVYAQDGLAWCYELSGRHQLALEARQKLTAMLKIESSTFSFAAVNDLGIADSFYAQRDYNDAYTFYDKFASSHPESPAAAAALYRAGFSLYRLKYYGQALETWQKLLQSAPASAEAKRAGAQIADTLFRAQRWPEAAAAYQRMLEGAAKGPQAPLAALRLAQIAFYSGKDDEALAKAQALIAEYPDAPQSGEAFDLSEAVFDRGAQRDYRSYFQSLVETAPRAVSAGEAQFRLGRRLYEHDDYAAAAQALQRFSVDYTDHPSLPKAQLMLGDCYLHQGLHEQAAAAFGRFVANFPQAEELPVALFKLGTEDFALKRYAPASAAFERLLAEFPKSEFGKPARFDLALSYRNAGQLDSASAAYSSYIASGVSDEEAQNARWELFAIAKDRKDYRGALKALDEIRVKAKAGSPAAVSAAYQVGEIAEASGDVDGARAAWETAAALGPADDSYRLQAVLKLTQIYEKKADWSRAVAAYEDVARNAPSQKATAAAKERIRELKRSASAVSTRQSE